MKRYRYRRKFGLWKVCAVIAVPLCITAAFSRYGSSSEKAELASVDTTEAAATVQSENFRRDNNEDELLCGSLILSHGYGVKAEIEQGGNYLRLVPPMDMTADVQGALPYPEVWGGGGEILRNTFGEYSGDAFFDLADGGQVNNKTDIANDELLGESWYMPNFTVDSLDKPLVLLYHTHTCESFEPYVRDEFDAEFNFRTTDETKNMVMVGNAIQAELEAQGISVVHVTDIHDHPTYNGAYDRSRQTILPILEQYPSIKVVLDIHRDALGDEIQAYQPFIRVEGKEAAQIMIISGCDDGTMGMPNYMENFHFACTLQQKLEKDHPGFTRPVLFDYRCYNQDLTNGSLLIEVGSHGNTLDQVQFAGQLLGKSLGELLINMSEE